MDEEISMTKRIIYGIMTVIVFIGLTAIAYNYFQIELTWKQTLKHFNEEVRLGTSYYSDKHSELILLLRETGFETYDANAFRLMGMCVIEGDVNHMEDIAEIVFDNCIEPVQYIKLIAHDGNYFIDAWTGEYAPQPLARGEKKAIVVEETEEPIMEKHTSGTEWTIIEDGKKYYKEYFQGQLMNCIEEEGIGDWGENKDITIIKKTCYATNPTVVEE